MIRRHVQTDMVELSDTYDIFLVGDKLSLVPLCFFHADKRLFNNFVLIIPDCRLLNEELDLGDSSGERGLDGVNWLSMPFFPNKLVRGNANRTPW